jgi:hypothetical protein
MNVGFLPLGERGFGEIQAFLIEIAKPQSTGVAGASSKGNGLAAYEANGGFRLL